MQTLDRFPLDEMTNEQLEHFMYQLDIGEDVDKPYYGHNFTIIDEEPEKL